MTHVLLVDDYRPLRFALARYLRLHGHTVTEVANVRAALEQVGEHVDVVIAALSMPGRSGAELVRALQGRGVRAPVILTSSAFPRPGETSGAAFVLQSPFDPEQVLEALDRVLTSAAAEVPPARTMSGATPRAR